MALAIAEWLKQSKGAQVVASLLLVFLIVNSILDFTLKAPVVFSGHSQQMENVTYEQTAGKLITTLQQTNIALDQIIVSNTGILKAVSENKAILESLNNMTHTMYNRQVTEDKFQGEIDALKKKVSSLQK